MTAPTMDTPTTERRHRSFTATILTAGATAADGLELAISSEAGVERVDYATGRTYLEVLDHGPKGPNLDYVKDGCPVLLDHDLGRQIGILRDVRVDQDRRIRGRFVPGKHPDAEWVYQDMAAGVRSKVSIGYWPGTDYEELKNCRRAAGNRPCDATADGRCTRRPPSRSRPTTALAWAAPVPTIPRRAPRHLRGQ